MTALELTDTLYQRFKGLPGLTKQEAKSLVIDAMRTHGHAPSHSVKPDEVNLVLLYAQYNGAWQIALSVPHYFKSADGEEQVDKSMIADNYRRLAKDLQA